MPSTNEQMKRKADYEAHQKRLREMKTTIDTRPPPEMPMSHRREIERRQKESLVELDNRLLLDRLAIAMSTKNIDNERKHVTFISLMEGKKKRELKRIEDDNRRLLQAIRKTVPVYNHLQWEKDAESRVHYLRNMTEFPDLFVPPGQGKKSAQPLSPTPSPLDRFKMNDGFISYDKRTVPNGPSQSQPSAGQDYSLDMGGVEDFKDYKINSASVGRTSTSDSGGGGGRSIARPMLLNDRT